MKASPLAHLSKWRCLASVVALLVVAFALVVGPVSQAHAQDGPQAFAVYTADNTTLTLYKAEEVPSVGDDYEGHVVTNVFTIDESEDYFGESPFGAVANVVENVEIAVPGDAGKIAPLSTDHWFEDFESLQEVDGWENADTSKVANTSYMYYNTDLSHGLSAPEFDTFSVTNMSYMFAFCSGLATPDFSSWDTSKVTNMENMFASCSSLSAPKLSGWNVSSVTNMSEMFYGCRSLTTLDLSAWTPTKVTTMSQMFYQCTALTSLDFSGWDTPDLTSLYYAFFQDAALTSLDFEGWSAPRLENLQHTFDRCTGLTSLDLSSWSASKVTDTSSTFLGCTSLTTLDLSGIGADGKYGYTFDQCAALSKVTLGAGWSFGDTRSLLPEAAGKLWYKVDAGGNPMGRGYTPDDLAEAWNGATMAGTWVLSEPISEPVVLEAFAVYCDTDKTLTLYKASDKPARNDTYNDKTVTYVFTIDETKTNYSTSPFSGYERAYESVVFAEPENADDKIAPASMSKWFSGFENAKSITGWENVDGSNIQSMSRAFENCYALSSIDLSDLRLTKATDLSWLFSGCTSLESADLTGLVRSGVTTITYMFNNCSALTELDLSSWNTSGITENNANWMFNGVTSLEKVTLGDRFDFVAGYGVSLPDVAGKLWYLTDENGDPTGTGYTGEELAEAWDGSTMAGTWQLTTEFEEPKPKPVELAGLPASDSLTYGETLTVTFTPKSGDDVVASGTATLKLGDTVLATSSEPQTDGSFSLSYITADKGVALGEQTLTVTFESTGYEAATGTVETTLSAKALTVEVTSSLDKTWDGSDEVDGLAVVLLGALGADDVTVSATGAYASSDAGEQDVTLTLALSGDDAAWYTISAPTDLTGTINAADIAGKLSLSGTPAFGETLTATYEPTSGEQVSYTWTRDGQVIDGATGSTYTLTKEDVGARIAVVAAASDANHAGSVTSDAVTVAKATQDAPAAPVATATSHTTIEVEALADSPAGAKAEYSIDGGQTWQTETTFTGLEPETEYTVIARFQELDTHGASEASEGTTVSTPVAPSEPDPDTPDMSDTPDPDEPDTPDTPDTPDPDRPAGTKPSERPKPEIPATGDAGAAAVVATALAGAVALGLGAHRRRS